MASVTIRYARALAEVVLDQKLIPGRIREQVHSVEQLVESNPDLRSIWENPAVPSVQKRKLLDAIARKLELDPRLGIADARVTSSRDLTTDERLAMENQIKRMTGKAVRASYATDRGLI